MYIRYNYLKLNLRFLGLLILLILFLVGITACLQQEYGLRMQIVDENGESVAGAIVKFGDRSPVQTGRTGIINIPRLNKGIYNYTVSHEKYYDKERQIFIDKDIVDYVVELESLETYNLDFIIMNEKKERLENIQVVLGNLEPAKTDSQGLAHFKDVLEGTYTYKLIDDNIGYLNKEGEIEVNQDINGLSFVMTHVGYVEKDWPQWQYDAERSANTAHELAEDLYLQWVRQLPEPMRAWPHQWDDRGKLDFDISYTPIVVGQRIFVPSNVTDSVTAYSIEDGSELWRFYANGPVRLSPAYWRDSVYFIADDGYLYCVEAKTGELNWKFHGGPSEHSLLGNERIINFWAARGGPVIKDGIIYFTAGIWPLHGIFIYALDAENGQVVWVNDTTSSDYAPLPHNAAYGYGGLAPQGYLAASEDKIVVAGGRTPPVFLDRQTGKFISGGFRAKPAGNYAVHAVGDGGMGLKENSTLSRLANDVLADQIDGEVFYYLAARDSFFVTTEDGKLYCFGPEKSETVYYEYSPFTLEPQTDDWADVAKELLQQLGEDEGYALIHGKGTGDLLRELLVGSNLHIVVIEKDTEKVRNLRDELVATGMYGRRAAVIEGEPAGFILQPYLFSLVLSEDVVDAGITADEVVMEAILNRLRPYSGLAWLGMEGADVSKFAEKAINADVDQVLIEVKSTHIFAKRGGPLSGAGEWTHQYHDPANTLISQDELVKLPLGILWFGGPNNHNILPRHSGGPRPQVAGGRQVFLGVETISARDVYTGRQLWEKEYPGIGHPFTNLELEESWADGRQVYMDNIPGATYIGSPFVTLADSIYLRYQGEIHHLNPVNGEIIDKFTLPGQTVEELYNSKNVPDWGHLSVQGDYLISTNEPHIFEDQELGWTHSYSGTSSKRLAVMDRYSGELLWEREAKIGFRHMAIISSQDTIFVIDGVSNNVVEHLMRRGMIGNLEKDNLTFLEVEKLISKGIDKAVEKFNSSKRYNLFTDDKIRNLLNTGDWENLGYSTLEEAILDLSFHLSLHYRNQPFFDLGKDQDNIMESIINAGMFVNDRSTLMAINLETGEIIWSDDSKVFGTYLLYSEEYDILLEGGSQDLRYRLDDEPRQITARRGSDGQIIWEGGNFLLPGVLRDDMLIPGRPGNAISLLTGERWQIEQPQTNYSNTWRYSRAYGCGTLNASQNLLLFRTGYAGFYDLEYNSGTGNFSGFRSGCTANMIAADGVLNALDYTRTCTCSYAHQTSLALIHMPKDSNIEFWTRYAASPPNPEGHGINFGAPGRRVDENGRVWHDVSGTHRRHASIIKNNGGGIDWVAASSREIENKGTITINDVVASTYIVRLHFAELNEEIELGQRVFNVYINDEEVLNEYDIIANAKEPFQGVVEEFIIDNPQMGMSIEFIQSAESHFGPMINGIELILKI